MESQRLGNGREHVGNKQKQGLGDDNNIIDYTMKKAR